MKAVDRFNGLNGSVVSRAKLGKLASDAERQGQPHLARRLRGLLAKHPEAEMELEIDGYEVQSMPADALHGLEEIAIASLPGLSRPVPQDDIYDYVTNLMLDTIKEVGHLPWQKQWSGSGSGRSAMNYVSGKEYSGINYLLLNFDIVSGAKGKPILVPVSFGQPYYLTIKQIEQAGAKLRKGSTHRKVIYYTMVMDYRDGTHSIKTSDRKKFEDFAKANGIGREKVDEHLITVPVIKYYRVFRADDCTGLSFPERPETNGDDPIEAAQRIIDGYPDPPGYTFGGDGAYYMPDHDVINMPHLSSFSGAPQYYSTFFHEQVHSTGHSKRLDRFARKVGKDEYAFEELVAELGAVFLCAQAGTLFHTRENSAKYLASWNRKLARELENDNRFFLRAAAKAQKAADLILSGSAESKKEKPADGKSQPKPRKRKKEGRQLELALKGRQRLEAQPELAVLPAAQPEMAAPATAKPAVPDPAEIKPAPIMPQAKEIRKGSIADIMSRPKEERENFKIESPDLRKLLGKPERKPKESLVITLAGGEGSGKTRGLFRMMRDFGQNYRCGHASMEEHPESGLYSEKVKQYLDAKSMNAICAPEITTAAQLEELIAASEVIFIDSWEKYREIFPGAEIDKDLRKKYDGKLFVVIFQLTAEGKMRGGSKSQFDGDIILSTQKFEDYRENFIYPTKNRYNDIPHGELKYRIFDGKLIGQAKPLQAANDHMHLGSPAKVQFSFEAVAR